MPDLAERSLQRERALARIGRAATSSLDLDTILRSALAVLGEAVSFKGGSVALLNESDELEIVAAVGLLDAEARAVRIPRGAGIVGWVLDHGEPFRSDDLDCETRIELPTRATGSNRLIRSYLAAPLIAGDHVRGVLQIDSEQPAAFGESDVELLAAVASQIAGAVNNAKLFADVRAERERLRAVIHNLPEAVVILDRDGMVIEANPAAQRLIVQPVAGVDAARVALHRSVPISEHESAVADDSASARALRGEQVSGVEIATTRPDGAVLNLRANAAPLRDAQSELAGAVVVYEDVTELKEIERLKDEFLATASHDLRNPLATVKGMVQLVQRRIRRGAGLDLEMITKSLETVERQADRLGEMLDTLMDVSRIQMGRLDLAVEPVDLAALVCETVEHRRPVTPSHDLRLSVEDGPIFVEAERARLIQVLENLVSNAIKYSPDGGVITVTVRTDDATVDLAVSDQGIGVAPDALPHLFDRFYRTDAVRGRQLEGSGLGLYISRGIIEAFGGHIHAESPGEGKGTRIAFTLPKVAVSDED